ncbi:AMP-binding protein [bacterium]|nr:AMP-binding protein [bacterium]
MNLYSSFAQAAESNLSKVALIDGEQSYTYAQLLHASQAFGAVLAASTDKPAIGIFLPTSAAFTIANFAAQRAGLAVLPLNLLAPPRDLLFAITDSGIDTVVTSERMVQMLQGLPVKFVLFEEIARAAAAGSQPPLSALQGREERKEDDLAVMLYTSGTSGTPKGVCLSHGNILTNIHDSLASFGEPVGEVTLGVLPSFHTFAYTATMGIPLHTGGTYITQPRFIPADALGAIEKHGVTLMLAIPTMYRVLTQMQKARGFKVDSLKHALAGGEPLPPVVEQEFHEAFGIPLWQGYGLTETSPVISFNTRASNVSGTAGKPIRNVEIRIIDDEGRELPAGEVGEILVKGPGIMLGYHQRPDLTAEVIKDGWLHTGDMGRLDENGHLAITGRKKEMIIVAGLKVFPPDVEAVLEGHPAVKNVAVLGVNDPVKGEQVKAYIVPRDEELWSGMAEGESEESVAARTAALKALEAELRAHAEAHLSPYKLPKVYEFRKELPLGPTGKVFKRALREELQ